MDVRCADLADALRGADAPTVERVSASLADQMELLGWVPLSATPGARSLTRNGRVVALDQLLAMLAGGHMSRENWVAVCAADTIGDLRVQLDVPGVTQQLTLIEGIPTPTAPQRMPMPVPERAMVEMNDRVKLRYAVIGLLIVLVVAVWAGEALSQRPEKPPPAGRSFAEIAASAPFEPLTGTSSIPDARVTVSYKPTEGDAAYSDHARGAGNSELEEGDGVWTLSWPAGKQTQAEFTVEQNSEPGADDDAFVSARQAQKYILAINYQGGTGDDFDIATVLGHDESYVWKYDTPIGHFQSYYVAEKDYGVLFTCAIHGDHGVKTAQRRCARIMKSAEFN